MWIRFITASLVIFFAGKGMPEYIRFFSYQPYRHPQLRFFFLSAIISLPELSVIIGTIVIAHDPGLGLASILGINLFNLFILALSLLLNKDRELHIPHITILFNIALMVIFCLGIWKGKMGFLHVSWASLILLITYLLYTKMFIDSAPATPYKPKLKTSIIYLRFFIASLLIFATGGPLAYACHEMITTFHLNNGLIGGFLLAGITCSPRLSASFSQLRDDKLSEVMNNTLQSNVFTLGILAFLTDLFYAKSSMFTMATNMHLWLALEGILLITIMCLTLLYKTRSVLNPFLVIIIYITSFLIFLYKTL